jgi:hypothetical protein
VLLSSAANINALPVIQKATALLPNSLPTDFLTPNRTATAKKTPTPKEAGGQENNF